MGRKTIKIDIIKSLFANSGNECAFPGCNHRIINENHKLVGELCHIEAYSPDGPRYNEQQSDIERNGYDNLVLMCHKHHNETHDLKYTVENLRNMKLSHESKYCENPYLIDMSIFFKMTYKNEIYWEEVEKINKNENFLDELKYEVNTQLAEEELISNIKKEINKLQTLTDVLDKSDNNLYEEMLNYLKKYQIDITKLEEVKYYLNPFLNRNWVIHNIGITNCMTNISLKLEQLEIKCLQNKLLLQPNNKILQNEVKVLEEKFKKTVKNTGYYD